MVFPSLPVYLDPPNWHQQLPNQQGQGQGLILDGNGSSPHHHHHHHQQLPPLPPPPHASGGGPTSSGSIRPGSMADRARLAKIPQPEPGLKCPRCESTNTKFCYFNNYSLTQPRHFCKACRRYWTRGGALRSVPVGGGCRRNKKSKVGGQSNSGGSSSSSKLISGSSANNNNNNSSSIPSTSTPLPSSIISQHHQLPFMASLHNLAQFQVGNLGLNFSGIGGHDHMGFQLGSNNSAGLMSNNNAILSSTSAAVGQVSYFDPQETSLFPFQHQGGGNINEATASTSIATSSRVSDDQVVKMEERGHGHGGGVNLPRQLLGVSENGGYWPGGGSTGAWSDLSGLN